MATEIKSPTFPESVIDGTVANWIKKEGDSVSQDEVIAEIETDKVVLEVVAPFDGQILKIYKNEGEVVNSSEKIADFDKVELDKDHGEKTAEKVKDDQVTQSSDMSEQQEKDIGKKVNPAAKKLIKENSLDSGQINPTGKKGRVTKSDVINHMNSDEENKTIKTPPSISPRDDEERVPMSRLRTTIANRLVTVQQETAMLTTFNEVDMQPIKDLRQKYGTEFEAEHGTKLGFMGFFVSASVQALLKFPLVNASIDGADIVYHGYQDIGVAVSTDRGLVVPVIRGAQNLSIAQIEKEILSKSEKARDGSLSIEEMQGGTFTISNGGIFGSLLSTPILNSPQTGILGMHKIQDRPIAVDGEVVIRPMMYLALSYDHRLLDGKEAVTFLLTIKELLETPERLLLNL